MSCPMNTMQPGWVGENPPPASACNAVNSAWGRPQYPALSTLAMLSSRVHREMNFNYKASHTDSTLLPCS